MLKLKRLLPKNVIALQTDSSDAIECGDFPKWKMYVQIMPELDAEKVPYHPFDLTKVWPKGDLQSIG